MYFPGENNKTHQHGCMPAAGGGRAAGAARAAAVHRRGGPAVAHGHQVQVAGGRGGAQAAQRPRQLVTPYVSTYRYIRRLPNLRTC